MFLKTVPLIRSLLVGLLVTEGGLLSVAGWTSSADVPQAIYSEESSPSTQVTVGLEEGDYDLVNAPTDVQACVQAIIGDEASAKLITRLRRPNQGENDAIGHCFSASNQLMSSSSSATGTTSPAVGSRSIPPSAVATPASTGVSSPNLSSRSPTPSPSPTVDIHAEVWTKNGYDGASYEYKVNCGSNYATLEECFLWDLTRVAVTAPSGQVYELAKDFNVNSYSGEITRRWVLYGPAGGGLPAAGTYTFSYEKNGTVVLTQILTYTPEVVDAPKNVTYVRDGDDLVIFWEAPAGISSQMWYKPSVDPPGNDRQIISQVEAWNQTSARLNDVPVGPGEQIEINVAVFFPGGYAYPQPLVITW